MKRHSREEFLNKIDDSPSPDITGDFLTSDYGNTNLDNHRRSSSSDSLDSGIGSTGSSRQSSLSSLEPKTNPLSSSQGIFHWKHPKHEYFRAKYVREIESNYLTGDQEKEQTDAAALERLREIKRGDLDALTKTEDISFFRERPESSDISSLAALNMKSLVLGFENELDDDITDTSRYPFQSAVTTQDQNTKIDLLETKSRVEKQDQGSRSVMENQIPDCEDLPPPIPQQNKIKTKRSSRLSKNVNPTNEPANLKTNYFAAGTQVKPKPTKLYGKNSALFPFSVSENQDIQNRDVRKYTTFSSDLPDADDVSSQDENKSGFKSIFGFPFEARGSKNAFFFKTRYQIRSQREKYQVKNSATEKWQDQFSFELPYSLSPDSLLMEKAEDEFFVLCDSNYLPRFKYHRSLLDWFVRGLPHDPDFQKCNFLDCSVIVGGNLSDEKKKELFGGADTFAFQNCQKDFLEESGPPLSKSMLRAYGYYIKRLS